MLLPVNAWGKRLPAAKTGAAGSAQRRRLRQMLTHVVWAPAPFFAPVSTDAGGRPGPLLGVKILDFCQFQNGPSATAQLADNGADVLKVEPLTGDGLRNTGKPGEFESGVENFNRGKRSITLDLKHPSSKEVLERLVKWADVVTENFRPGVMSKLGLGYEVLKRWNPKIVCASNSGFGPEGEWASRPSFDGIAQAFSGVMTAMGGGPSHQPMRIEWTFADEVGAMNFLSSILMGLVARDRTGEGQEIVTSQTAATLFFQRASVTRNLKNGTQRDDGEPPGHVMRAGQMLVQASDGLWMMISPGTRDQNRRFLTEALERKDVLEDKRVRRESDADKNWFLGEVRKTIATKPRQYWLDALLKADVPAAPCA